MHDCWVLSVSNDGDYRHEVRVFPDLGSGLRAFMLIVGSSPVRELRDHDCSLSGMMVVHEGDLTACLQLVLGTPSVAVRR